MYQPDHSHDRGPLGRSALLEPSRMYRVAMGWEEAELGAFILPPPDDIEGVGTVLEHELFYQAGFPIYVKSYETRYMCDNARGWYEVQPLTVMRMVERVLTAAMFYKEDEVTHPLVCAWRRPTVFSSDVAKVLAYLDETTLDFFPKEDAPLVRLG